MKFILRCLAAILVFSVTFSTPPVLRTSHAATVVGERMDVPNFRQIWSPWGLQKIGFSSKDIEVAGCALTSLSMVFKYYGIETNPEDLNNWLKENGGYAGQSAIDWSIAAARSNGTVRYMGRTDYNNGQADLNLINSELDSGYPVIARMDFQSTDHYIVITGRSGSTYFMNDPFYDDPSLTVNEQYFPKNDPAHAIRGIVLFHGSYFPPRVPVIPTVRNHTSIHKYRDPVKKTKTTKVVLQIGNPVMSVNGVSKEIDPGNSTKPIIYYNDTTLLPIRAVVEELGGTIDWMDSERKITIKLNDKTLELWINDKFAFYNGVATEIEVSPKLINSRTMLPLRFIAETLNCTVDWDGATQKITITY